MRPITYTYYGSVGVFADVVRCAKFGVGIFRGLRFSGGQFWPFPCNGKEIRLHNYHAGPDFAVYVGLT